MKQFFKMFFASLLALAVGGLGMFALAAALVSVLSKFEKAEIVVREGSAMVFDLSVNLQDAPVGTRPEDLIGEALGGGGPKRMALRDALDSIEAAAADDRITALFLHGSFAPLDYGTGFAALREVRQAVTDFKATGKPVLAYLVYPSARDLYVASLADRIIMDPNGLFLNAGMAAQPIFVAGFLEKYGVGAQVVKAGAYKSAAESFLRESMSEPARRQTRELLDDLWGDYRQTVAEGAGMPPEALQELIDDKGFLSAQDALDTGIVDELAYMDGAIASMQEIAAPSDNGKSFRQISLDDYLAAVERNRYSKDGHVAVVYAEGPIIVGEGDRGQVSGKRLAREIRRLRQDEKTRALVLRVNSPGGSALASDMIAREIDLARERMPVVVSMGAVAASGGYWIAANADRVFAQPNTITGSIGVIGLFFNVKELANRHGVTFDTVKTAKYADFLSPARPKTEAEMRLAQSWVDEVYADFLERVAEGRELSLERVSELAEGRVWSGADALERGLVDEVGGLERSIAHAAALAGLGPEPAVRDYPQPGNWLEELMGRVGKGGDPISGSLPGGDALRAALRELAALKRFDDPKGAYLILPFSLRVE